MRAIVFLVLILFLAGCKNKKEWKEYEYFDDGSVLSTKYYSIKNGVKTFEHIQFFQNGDTNYHGTFVNNKPHGILKTYKQGNRLHYKTTFFEGKEHGVFYVYDTERQELNQETLFINGTKLIIGKYSNDPDSLKVLAYHYPYITEADTAFEFFGSVVWNERGELVQKMISYFHIDAPGVIENRKPYQIDVTFQIGLYSGSYFELTLGEIDENLSFIDSSQLKTYTSDGDKLSFSITDYDKGVNLLLGKIKYYSPGIEGPHTLFEDSTHNEYIFYHQFEVLE